MVRALTICAILSLAACETSLVEPSGRDLAADGREIAEVQCARCHAVGSYGESSDPAAPPFRTILSRYPSDVLEEELIAGIEVVHPMPSFQFNPVGTDALIAYLRSIQEKSPGGANSDTNGVRDTSQ